MTAPGFSAEQALNFSRTHYRSSGMVGPSGSDLLPSFSEAPLESSILWFGSCDEFRWTSSSHDVCTHEICMTDSRHTVLPMGVPAHTTDTSSQCSQCFANCQTDFLYWLADFEAGCLALLAIPFVGGALWAACAGVAAPLAAGQIYNDCLSSCLRTGGECCPVACGSSCCNYSETCSSTTAGLCCSSGTTPCGTMCCTGNEVCSNGFCCPRGTTACADGTCCDPNCGSCQTGTCVPFPDGTSCLNGETCCGGTCTTLISDSNNCGSCGNKCTGITSLCIGGLCSAGE